MDTLSIPYDSWAYLLCPLTGLAFAWGMYWRDTRTAAFSRSVKLVLAGCRFLAVALITFLLLGPYLRYLDTTLERPVIAVGIDKSASMGMGADSLSTKAAVQQLLAALQSTKPDNADVQLYLFGDRVRSYVNGADSAAADPVTDISAFFEAMRDRYENRNLAAIVLASDGMYNRGKDPRYATSGLSAPIYTLALGDTSTRRDAAIAEVAANSIAYLGNSFPIEARITADKLQGQRLSYTLSRDGSVLQRGSFVPASENAEELVKFTVEAQHVGLQRYELEIAAELEESTVANNSREVYIEILDSKQQVLIVAAAPHPDVAALRRAVEASENYSVQVVLQGDLREVKPETDLLILHNVPSEEGSQAVMELIDRSDVPYLLVVGTLTSTAQLKEVDAGIERDRGNRGFSTVSASANPNFTLYKVSDQWPEAIADAPPLKMPFGSWRIANVYEPLLFQKVGNIVTTEPLMGVSVPAGRRKAFVLGEGMWRWRLYMYATTGSHALFDEFINGLVQYLAAVEDKRLFRVSGPRSVMENEPVVLQAEVYNAAYQSVQDADVSVVITDSEGKSYPFAFSPSGQGYRLDTGILPVGNYSWKATATREGASYTDRGAFSVKPYSLEAITVKADHKLLQALSVQSGGSMVTADSAAYLPLLLTQSESIKPVSYSSEIFSSLVNLKWLFFALLLLLSTEWFVRKRSGAY